MSDIGLDQKPGFLKSFKKHQKRNPRIVQSFKVFTSHKKKRPPLSLPPSFKDHKLHGRLSKFSEVHLAQDSVLVYQDLGHVINLIRVASHAELEGPRQKSF